MSKTCARHKQMCTLSFLSLRLRRKRRKGIPKRRLVGKMPLFEILTTKNDCKYAKYLNSVRSEGARSRPRAPLLERTQADYSIFLGADTCRSSNQNGTTVDVEQSRDIRALTGFQTLLYDARILQSSVEESKQTPRHESDIVAGLDQLEAEGNQHHTTESPLSFSCTDHSTSPILASSRCDHRDHMPPTKSPAEKIVRPLFTPAPKDLRNTRGAISYDEMDENAEMRWLRLC